MRPMTASMATLFPEPDSPTTPKSSPFSKVRSTPSTARNGPRWVWNSTERLRISSSAISALQLGVEGVAQPIAQEVEGQHRHQDCEAGEGYGPIGALDVLPRIGQHGAPFRRRWLGTEVEEAERRGIEHRRRNAEGRL